VSRTYCRVALVFNITEDEIEGTDVGGLNAAIEVVEDGVRHSVRIGSAIDFEIEDIAPFGSESGQPVRFDGMFHPVASNLTMAEAKGFEHQRVRHRVRGKVGAVDLRSRGPPEQRPTRGPGLATRERDVNRQRQANVAAAVRRRNQNG
jgi:hypothetical protein